LVAALLLTVVSGSVLFGVLPLIAWPYLLKKGVDRGAEKQRAKFADTLPSYLQDMASAIRVGRSFAGAVTVVADSADEPTRSQLERAATDEALGLPLEETLQAVSNRMHSNDMDQVALIAGVHRRTGSNISEALDRVAEGARERADLRREMRALTSQAKMSSSVLTGLPVVLLLGLTVLSPSYAHPLLHTTLGLMALGVGAVMIFGGWKVMGKITRIKV
jgi:tight adherence protein B